MDFNVKRLCKVEMVVANLPEYGDGSLTIRQGKDQVIRLARKGDTLNPLEKGDYQMEVTAGPSGHFYGTLRISYKERTTYLNISLAPGDKDSKAGNLRISALETSHAGEDAPPPEDRIKVHVYGTYVPSPHANLPDAFKVESVGVDYE